MAASERSQRTLRLASLFGLCRDILRSHLLICRIFNYQFPAWRNARRRSAQLKCQGTNRPSPALNPGSVELRRVLAKPRVFTHNSRINALGGFMVATRSGDFQLRLMAIVRPKGGRSPQHSFEGGHPRVASWDGRGGWMDITPGLAPRLALPHIARKSPL